MTAEDGGAGHLRRIAWIQAALLPVGGALWALRSWRAVPAFLAGGIASLAFWSLHRWVVGGMLTPSVRRRWLFALAAMGKLALIVVLLRGMMVCFPSEVLPFATGILLFSAAIVVEAIRLVFRPE